MEKKVMYRALQLLLLLGLYQYAAAQPAGDIPVSGTVRSSTGEALIGVTITVKGASRGVTTDAKGAYHLNVPEKAVLVVSYLGYQSQEVPVNGKKQIDITLETANTGINEVVVVGYGTQKKVSLTGAVATLSAEKLKVVPTANVGTLLYGNLPGLIPVQRSGEPGNDGVQFSIRGFPNALVVVDGIVGRDFDRLNPAEIESVTILKDAASAAVYGVSGGNGVVLVTTKKGKLGKPEFSYTLNYGIQRITNYPKFVNSAQFAELKNEASTNMGGPLVYTQEEIEKFRTGTPEYPNVDYYDFFIRDNTPQWQQDLTVQGGTENIRYFFLLSGLKQEAMWKGGNQDYAKYNFRSNVDARINDNLDISVQFSARTEDRNNLVQDSYLMSSWLQYQWPIFEPKTPDGKVASSNYGLSAYLDRDLTGYLSDVRNIFRGNLTINYKIPFVEGLSARLTASRDLWFQNNKQWRKAYGLYTWNAATKTSTQTGTRENNSLLLENINASSVRIQGSLNYTRTFFRKHNVSALLLYEESEDRGFDFSASRVNYVLPIDQIFAGPDKDKNNGGGASDNGRQSLVGRLNYDFDGKYLFEYSFRYDGSPKFPPDKRWGYFSGVSAGWRLSEESFFKDNFPTINNFKLRGSWGKLGSDQTGNFQFLTGYNYPSASYILGTNVVTNGLVESGMPNPNITWEESTMLNLGFDLSLWKSLLEIEVDVFHRKRDGILATRALQLPSTFGASLPAENLNSDDTRGFEIVVRHNNKIGAIRYDVSSNLSFTKTKWDHVEQREFTSQYDNWKGNVENRWVNRYFGLKALGQFQSQEEINNSPVQDGKANSMLRPGDIKYEDFNKDGIIDANDNQPIGRGDIPELNFGLGLNLYWRQLSVSMNWQGAANFNQLQTQNLIAPFNNDMGSYAYFMDRWHREDMTDPNSKWIPGKYPSTINNGAPNNNQVSSFWLKDASYLRLKSLNISYNLENALLTRYGIKHVTLTLSGQNLLTFSALKYMDPEAPSGGRGSYYPQQKTYNAGINVTF